MALRRFVLLVLLLAASVQFSCSTAAVDQPAPQIAVYFSPNGGCTDAVVKELDAAKESVLVQAYSFTSAPIAKALMEAHKRGVKVQVILDKSQRTEKYSSATFFQNVGIPTFIDDKHAIAHNKVMVIDGRIVITGIVQLHEGGGRVERREPAGHSGRGLGGEVREELAGASGAFGAV